ncbi:PTS transporter subunit EIIC [Serratia marcescens]|uniref:PTS transporter subunit EIIC n=1 Tax=Serratia marcescens TaxID=615 RepID=UPI001874BDA1|nr:PTS transporter subunit EIIC [Serratia marcescens]MBE5258070.1 PTS transporter subunit EIIC [Serratia marcescens]MBE5298702.1 PTS transporter subunit EIIC [Serratia marcescens]MBE5303586.1 PTS transporter subunit EIIC [Serratia marcescens]
MDKTTALATQILAGVGGEGNILKLENCMTRVRVEVSDEQRLDLAALKQLPGVKGYIKQGEQHQFIVGPGAAAKVVDAMRALLSGSAQPVVAVGDAARTKAQAKQKYAAPMSGALKKLADVFIPLIPAFIASGLITGIINLLKRPDIAGQLAVDYPNVLGLLAIFGSAVFAIMNILVGVNAARVFGGSQAMAGVGQVGAALAVLLKTRNARLKKVIKGALPVGILGIGEPLIFGVTLPLGRPFIGACLGGAVGGALISYWKVATVITFGISGLPLALTIVSGKVMLYLAGMLITIIAGFLFTWMMGFNDPEE